MRRVSQGKAKSSIYARCLDSGDQCPANQHKMLVIFASAINGSEQELSFCKR